jgi:hypothetical protein
MTAIDERVLNFTRSNAHGQPDAEQRQQTQSLQANRDQSLPARYLSCRPTKTQAPCGCSRFISSFQIRSCPSMSTNTSRNLCTSPACPGTSLAGSTGSGNAPGKRRPRLSPRRRQFYRKLGSRIMIKLPGALAPQTR